MLLVGVAFKLSFEGTPIAVNSKCNVTDVPLVVGAAAQLWNIC